MNHTFQSIRVGVFFILGLVLIYTVYAVIGSGKIGGKEGYDLRARFDNLRTLTAGADVRMAGVRIGEVAETSLVEGRGQVTLQIDPQYAIPSDSVATITMASLLGQNYVAVEYGQSGQTLEAGAEIPTRESPDFNEILGEVKQLGERLNAIADSFPDMDSSGMGDMFRNINDLVTENRGRFDTVMNNLETLTNKLNSTEGTLGKLINEGSLYEELMGIAGEFREASDGFQETIGTIQDLVARVEQGEGSLGRLLVDDTVADDLEATVANFRAFSEKLNSGEGTLGKLVTDDSLFVDLQNILNRADKAFDSLGDSGPITAAAAVSGALF